MASTSAAARPTVSVFTDGKVTSTVALPQVFLAPIRADVVNFVHTNMRKNHRQAYAVAYASGEQTSAMSWGTGRAVARIPRVSGGGSGRSGQGAFGNMCRGGRMFAPTKIWRRWHRKVNVAQRRYAVASALAASAVPALVMARGHQVENVPEIPLVLSGVSALEKTKEALKFLDKHGVSKDIQRVVDSRKVRAGRGKSRNRRYVQRRGPLVVYGDTDGDCAHAFRNIPGVDLVHIDRLNLLQLAPGGHMGRFCVWTEDAFKRLDALFGSLTAKSAEKKGFLLSRPAMANADLARLINSNEVQSVVNPAVRNRRLTRQKKNPLKNKKAMFKLNPYSKVVRETEMKNEKARAEAKAAANAAKRGLPVTAAAKQSTRYSKVRRNNSKNFLRSVMSDEFVRPKDVKKA